MIMIMIIIIIIIIINIGARGAVDRELGFFFIWSFEREDIEKII